MKIVKVNWLDACAYATQGWLPKEESDKDEFATLPCVTVGMLYLEDSERITVILSDNDHSFSQAQTIPKGCIVSIEVLDGSSESQ